MSGRVQVRFAVNVPDSVDLKPPPVRMRACVCVPPLANPSDCPLTPLAGTLPMNAAPVSRKLFPATRKPAPLSEQSASAVALVLRQTVVVTCPSIGVQLTRTPCEPLTVIGADLRLRADVPVPVLPEPPPVGNASTARIW